MNCVDVVLETNRDDGIDVEVRFDRFPFFADLIRLVRFEPMQSKPIFVRINRNGPNAQFVGGTENTNRNFASIRD